MAAVFHNFIHIKIHRLRKTLLYLVEIFLNFRISFRSFPFFKKLVKPLGINYNRGCFRNTVGYIGKLAQRNFPVKKKACVCRQSSQKYLGNNDHNDNFFNKRAFYIVSKQELPVFSVCIRKKQEKPLRLILPRPGHQTKNGDRTYNNDSFIQDIDNNVCQKLRREFGKTEMFVNRKRKRCRNSLAEIVSVKKICKHRTKTSADNGKNKNGSNYAADVLEEAVPVENRRHAAYQNAD